MSSFDSENPDFEVYILTGPRGVGKTVTLSVLENNYRKKKDWIVVDLNPEMDMLEQLASLLYEEGKAKHLFLKTEFSFSFHGVSLKIGSGNPVSNVVTFLNKIFDYFKKKQIRVFIGVDEASNNLNLKIFSHVFQGFLRLGYPIFLVMTGLYENVSSLQDEKTLTFLYRAPKIFLSFLDLSAIAFSYKQVLGSDDTESRELAKLTKGYAFAYQLFGYILYRRSLKYVNDVVLREYDELLRTRVYSKIWSELPKKEKDILKSMIKENGDSNQGITKNTGLSQNALAVYKKRLMDKGLIFIPERAKISFSLPCFKEFIFYMIDFEII